ncbi:MAG: GNAT family N-acetyltransferase [Eubacteriales bacterium]|nr:GNAT family N-acetyltransferase [Eubacteriales bacterium]
MNTAEQNRQNKGITLRTVSVQDARQLLRIYEPYVRNTAITFEYQTPSLEEFTERIRQIQKRYPYLAAEKDGKILGYTYAGTFKNRDAYDWAAETSIYVDPEHKGEGLGRLLYEALEEALRAQGILNAEACIGVPQNGGEDEYLTMDSVRFHERMGYRMAGEFIRCGCKYGRWYNMVWMEKHIGRHVENQPPVKAFLQVEDELRKKGVFL